MYVQNRCPHQTLDFKAPEEVFTSKKPECWAHDPPRKVLGFRAQILVINCIFDVKTLHFVGAERVACK